MPRMRDDKGDDAECQWCRFAREFFSNRFRKAKNRRDKFESEDSEGVWLGHNREANEVLIGTTPGVVRAFSYRRRSEGSRWDADLIKNM